MNGVMNWYYAPSEMTRQRRASPVTDNPVRAAYRLRCVDCRNPLSDCAMKATLLASRKTVMFSAESVTEFLQPISEDTYSTDLCGCEVMDLGCVNCAKALGYCVVTACPVCLKEGNGQRHVFRLRDVKAERNSRWGWAGNFVRKELIPFEIPGR